MAGAALHPRATLTLDYLCGVLERAGLITNEQRREALARGDVAHARLLRQRSTGPRKRGASIGEGVHPACQLEDAHTVGPAVDEIAAEGEAMATRIEARGGEEVAQLLCATLHVAHE